jgi:hypothetical protein
LNFEDTAAEIVNRDRPGSFLFEAISQGGRSRLFDNPQYVESGNAARFLGRLTLSIV